MEKVEAHIVDAVNKEAKVVTGGKHSALGGTFFEPTVLTDVTTDMVITGVERNPLHEAQCVLRDAPGCAGSLLSTRVRR